MLLSHDCWLRISEVAGLTVDAVVDQRGAEDVVMRGVAVFLPGGVNGGSVGDSHGRRDEGSGSGQWEALDVIVPAWAACPRARGSILGARVDRTLAASFPP